MAAWCARRFHSCAEAFYSSLPGLTRQSMMRRRFLDFSSKLRAPLVGMDRRVKPGGGEEKDAARS